MKNVDIQVSLICIVFYTDFSINSVLLMNKEMLHLVFSERNSVEFILFFHYMHSKRKSWTGLVSFSFLYCSSNFWGGCNTTSSQKG